MNEYLVGLDLGSSKICAAVGKLDKSGKLRILGITSYSSEGIENGVITDVENTASCIRKCINQLDEMVGIKIKDCYVSMPMGLCETFKDRGVVTVSAEDKEIKANDVEKVIKVVKNNSTSNDKTVISAIPCYFTIDGFENIINPIGMCGTHLEAETQVITVRNSMLTDIINCVNNAGLNVSGVLPQAFSIAETVLTKEESKIGSAIIDVGADTIDISIFKDNKLIYFNTISLGGNTISKDISICLKMPFKDAEKLKLKYSTIKQQEIDEKIKVSGSFDEMIEIQYNTLIQIIEARVEELFEMIGTRIYEAGYFSDITSIIVVGGGISPIKGAIELGRSILDKPIRTGTPEYVGAASPLYCTAIGNIEVAINSSLKELCVYSDSKQNSEAISKQKDKDSDNGVLSKIKEFLADFF